MSKGRDKKSRAATSDAASMDSAAVENEADEVVADTPAADAEAGIEAADPEVGEVSADETGFENEVLSEEPIDELELVRDERDDMKEKWLRAMAEMDNLRKRTRREVEDTRRFARAEVLRAFLEIQDNFERALQSGADDSDTELAEKFREGVALIFQRLRGVLLEQGVQAIEAQDAPFDPTVHEAVGQLPREGVEPGIVIEVAQPGFRLGDLVLRPARVIISA